MHIPLNVLTSPSVAPAALTSAIDLTVAEVNESAATVARLEEHLSFELALQRLGMTSRSKPMLEELDRELAKLESQRRKLAGLRAIEAARNALPPNALVPERGAKFIFDKRGGATLVPGG